MQKVVEKFLTGPQYINILVIEFKEIGVVPIGTFSIFEKLDFPFYASFCHMKTAPPINTFGFYRPLFFVPKGDKKVSQNLVLIFMLN